MRSVLIYSCFVTCAILLVACSKGTNAEARESVEVEESSVVLDGATFFRTAPLAQKAAQEAFYEQARPLFEACGVIWAGDKKGGDALFGNIELRIASDAKFVHITSLNPPTIDSSKDGSSLTIGKAVSDCVRNAFDSVSYPSKEEYSYDVSYPFCIKKPQDCPASVNLPPLNTEAYFLSLPNREESIIPDFEKIVQSPELQSEKVYKQCRCGICRVVAVNGSVEERDVWMRIIQQNARKQWELSDSHPMVITTERPSEVEEGLFTHAYVQFAESP